MKKYCVIIFLFGSFTLGAQGFFDNLTSTSEGQGTVRVYQDPQIVSAMAEKAKQNKENANVGKDHIVMSGYRVQVYSSNTPRTSKTEAHQMETTVRNKFKNIEVYVTFASPFWKVRVGDCRTYQEATDLLNLLRKEFPKDGGEFYIVRENIRIPI